MKNRYSIRLFLVLSLILFFTIVFVIAADLTPGIQIQPNSMIITISAYDKNMSFDEKTFVFEEIEIDSTEIRLKNDTDSSPIKFNSTLSFKNLNITLINWNLTQRNVTTKVSGSTLPNFLYFNITRNDSSPCYFNQTDVTDGYLNDYCVAYLETLLVNPDTSKPTNIIQNKTFTVNATVYCRDSDCGDVYGTVMYNLSSLNPDASINTTEGDKPFYVQEPTPLAMKACPTNPLLKDEFCNITWTVNATGSVNGGWKIGVLFNSSYTDILENNTLNATVVINSCTEDFNLQWGSIKFGLLSPNTVPYEAPGNPGKEYNITTNDGSCNLNFYISGTDLVNITLNSNINVGNVTWSNASNDYGSSYNLSTELTPIMLDVQKNTNVTTWYWINVPSVYAGYYNGNITITGVRND